MYCEVKSRFVRGPAGQTREWAPKRFRALLAAVFLWALAQSAWAFGPSTAEPSAAPDKPTAAALFLALDAGSAPRLSELLSEGADPNARDAEGEPALIYVLHHDHPELASVLLAAPGIQVDAENAHQQTALMVAAYQGRTQLMEALLDAGAEVSHSGWTALHFAALGDQPSAVRLLLDHSAYIDALSPNGTTALMAAARGKSRRVCVILIQAGADPTPVNEAGLSAAGFARAAGDSELAEWLRANEAAYRHAHPSLFPDGQAGAPGAIVR